MSRLRNFPNTISVGINSQGKLILLPEKAAWDIFTREGIKKVETYSLPSVSTISKRPRRKPPVKTAPNNPQEKPPEQQNNESSEKAMFHCTACGRDVDNPKTVPNGISKGKTQCPHCLKIGTIEGKKE